MATLTTQAIEIEVHPPESQARGSFDGGKIREIKPIGFPGEGSAVRRVGPLFYWAWATADEPSLIGLHPHRGFEIMSYVLSGELAHRDTLGTRSRVSAGGAQMMQTGSGVSHEEEMLEAGTQFFQIWFEPNLQEALGRKPVYREFRSEDLPVRESDGVKVKSVLGGTAPFSYVADASVEDLWIDRGRTCRRALREGRALAVVAVEGEGQWEVDGREPIPFSARDFTVIRALRDAEVRVRPSGNSPLRLAVVETVAAVDYPLYSS